MPQLNEQPPDPGGQFTHELPGDAAAMANAASWFDSLGPDVRSASLAVGRGEGTDIDWLGAYDWEPGAAPVWSPDD